MGAFGGTIGENRANAFWRILFMAIMLLGGAIVLAVLWTIAVIAGTIWFVIDVLWQLVTDDSGWTSGRMGAAAWLERLFFWPIDMMTWALFGDGSFPWLP